MTMKTASAVKSCTAQTEAVGQLRIKITHLRVFYYILEQAVYRDTPFNPLVSHCVLVVTALLQQVTSKSEFTELLYT